MEPDKLIHFLGGFCIAATGAMLGHPYLGLALAALTGAGKELWDLAHPSEATADVWDLLATVCGGLLACGIGCVRFYWGAP